MRILFLILGLLIVTISASATTASYTNTSNPTISPNMMVGDKFNLAVSGSPSSTVTADSAGGHFVIGTTDGNGVWQLLNGTAVDVGNWTVTYSVAGVAAPTNSFVIADGPVKMVTQVDQWGLCSLCQTTISRFVTYQVQKFNGGNVGSIPICENIHLGNWNCQEPEPGASANTCNVDNGQTDSSGSFTDEWPVNNDFEAGCGWSVDDEWQWPWPVSQPVPFGHLQGSALTNSITINGTVQPGGGFPNGTVISR